MPRSSRGRRVRSAVSARDIEMRTQEEELEFRRELERVWNIAITVRDLISARFLKFMIYTQIALMHRWQGNVSYFFKFWGPSYNRSIYLIFFKF